MSKDLFDKILQASNAISKVSRTSPFGIFRKVRIKKVRINKINRIKKKLKEYENKMV
jgi:hypothetical protein